MVGALLILIPISRRLDRLLLPVFAAVRFRWAEITVRERTTLALLRSGDVRRALAMRREGVEQAVQRGGFELAVATASYGMLLMGAGWIGEGIEYVRVAAWMTGDWPVGEMRDLILYSLAGGHAFRGEEEAFVGQVASQTRPSAIWQTRFRILRAIAQTAADQSADAVATYREALAGAPLAARIELVPLIHNNLVGPLTQLGEFAAAEAHLKAGEALVSATNPMRASFLGSRAALALAQGDLSAAKEALDRSETMKAQMGVEGGIGWTLATRARLEGASGNQAEAKRLLEESADKLQDLGALSAWRLAARAIGEPDDAVRIAQPVSDPLLARAAALAEKLPFWSWEIHRGIFVGLSVGLGLALVWLFVSLHDRIPGGWTTVVAFYVLLILLVVFSVVFRRVPIRRLPLTSGPGSP